MKRKEKDYGAPDIYSPLSCFPNFSHSVVLFFLYVSIGIRMNRFAASVCVCTVYVCVIVQ